MTHYNQSTRQRVADINLGLRVDRATATLPATTAAAIFNVLGGRVAVTIVGEVTTVLGAVVTNLSIQSNPTTGTTTAMCGVLAIANLEAGTLFTIDGTAATALQAGSSGSVRGQNTPVIVAIGAIELLTSATNTGSVKWSIFYVPIDDGAYIAAA